MTGSVRCFGRLWPCERNLRPEPDFRRTRLQALRLQLEPLTRQALAAPADSPERAAVNIRLIEVMLAVVALRQELKG